MTKFYIERHGESLGNYHKIFLGFTDLDLTGTGYEQAESTALAMKDTPLDAIFASPLKRARNTALPHLKYHPLTVEISPAFEEIASGEWEGLERSRISQRWPGQLDSYFNEGFGAVVPEGGEHPLHAAERFASGLRGAAERFPDGNVLVVCHAAVLRAFCCSLTTDDVTRWGRLLPFAANASVTEVTFDGEKFTLERYPTENAFRL